MTVRKAQENDIDSIVSLLKEGMGETLMPKSVNYWRWKHVQNPFGISPVLLAFENDQLIGVRAFMQWQWQTGNKVIRAVRAVDTVTHPAHQGKGIFSSLTKSLRDGCAKDGFSFVFNTPNEKSRPGYLKLGWKDVGKLPVSIKPKPIAGLAHIFGVSSSRQPTLSWLDHTGVQDLLNSVSKETKLRTLTSVGYLNWRYRNVPVVSYDSCAVESGNTLAALAIFRIKESRWGKELRVTDAFFRDKTAAAQIGKEIESIAFNCRATAITISGLGDHRLFSPVLKFKGPFVTVCPLNELQSNTDNFDGWKPSLGDLELF